MPSLDRMGYSRYTTIVSQIFTKIPKSFFIDAMLNYQGWHRLKTKFEQTFGCKNALLKYSENLENMYSYKRFMGKEQSKVAHIKEKVIFAHTYKKRSSYHRKSNTSQKINLLAKFFHFLSKLKDGFILKITCRQK